MVRDKILKVISEIDNIAIILTTDCKNDTNDYSHELVAVLKADVINFIGKVNFEVELSYTSCDQALLVLKFDKMYSTLEINKYWGCYHKVRMFDTLELNLNYRDYFKLSGIGYNDILDKFKMQLS